MRLKKRKEVFALGTGGFYALIGASKKLSRREEEKWWMQLGKGMRLKKSEVDGRTIGLLVSTLASIGANKVE